MRTPHRHADDGAKAAFPVSAMIDIVFLLLIYFIITFTHERIEAQLAVNLPSEGPRGGGGHIEIRVGPGTLHLQSCAMTRSELAEHMAHFGQLDPEVRVLVKTRLDATADDVVAVLDICKGKDLRNVSLLTLRDSGAGRAQK